VGTSTSVNNGIATTFASGEMSETLPNDVSSSGTSPIVTAIWTRAKPAIGPSRRARPATASKMIATAPNDSQAPGASGANGSTSSTPIRARPSACATASWRRYQRAAK